MNSSVKERIKFIDLAKGFCIIFVVFHHICVQTDYKTVFDIPMGSFRMPLYYILSGLFFKEYSGIADFTFRKINKLLIPFIFFYLITSFFIPLVLNDYFEFKGLQNGISGALFAFVFEDSYPNNPIWFLISLFETNMVFYVIVIILKKVISPTYRLQFIILMSICIGALGFGFNVLNIDVPLYFDSSLSCLPFFMFGYILYRKTMFLYPNKYDKFNYVFLVGGLLFLLIFSEPIFVIQNKYSNFLSFYLCGVIGTLCILILSKKIETFPFISYWGRYSIMILLTHNYIVRIIMILFKGFELNKASLTFLTLIITMFMYQILIPIMKRYLPYVTAQKDLIKLNN